MPSRQEEQIAGLGHPAAKDEAPRVEDRGQVGHELAEVPPHDVEAFARGGVALLGSQGDLLSLDALGNSSAELEEPTGERWGGGRQLTGLVHERAAARVLLVTAAVPAAAAATVGYGVRMPDLRPDAEAASKESVADDDSRHRLPCRSSA